MRTSRPVVVNDTAERPKEARAYSMLEKPETGPLTTIALRQGTAGR